MSAQYHLAVWLDHRNARVLSVTRDAAKETVIHCHDDGKGHIHHHSGTTGAGHAGLDRRFLEDISAAIGEAREILILGPAQAKHALKSFLTEHKPLQAKHVMGVEAMDHAGAAEIADFARRFFAKADPMIKASSATS